MRKFEYKVVNMLGLTMVAREQALNANGAAGWELCAVDCGQYIFKREITND